MDWTQFEAARRNERIRGKWADLIRALSPGVPYPVPVADNVGARADARHAIKQAARKLHIEVETVIVDDRLWVARPPEKPVVSTEGGRAGVADYPPPQTLSEIRSPSDRLRTEHARRTGT